MKVVEVVELIKRELYSSNVLFLLYFNTCIDVFFGFFMFVIFYIYNRINQGRRDWINIIEEKQTLNKHIQLYICDLHFHQNDLRKFEKNVLYEKVLYRI